MAAYAEVATETMEHARHSGEPAALCIAHMMFSNLSNYTGKWAAAELHISEAARHYRADQHQGSVHLSGLDIGLHIPINFSIVHSFRGSYAAAERSRKECLSRAAAQPQAWAHCWAIFWVSLSALIEREFECAGALADRGVELATEYALGFWRTVNQLSQGAASVIADPGRAATLIDEPCRGSKSHGPSLGTTISCASRQKRCCGFTGSWRLGLLSIMHLR
jgi:hypothetical protein